MLPVVPDKTAEYPAGAEEVKFLLLSVYTGDEAERVLMLSVPVTVT